LNKGFKSGFVSGFGAATADVIYAIIVGFSITFISDFIIKNQDYFRIIGGIFLIYIGYKIFISNPAKQIRRLRSRGNKFFKDFFTSFLLTISNPITILAFGAFYTSFGLLESDTRTSTILILILAVYGGAILWWLCLIGIVTIFKKRIRLRNLLWINRITGLLIVIFAILLILSVFLPETISLGH
jgi:threonine/homoserine/homoserine lactone efflux protein